MKNVSLKLKTLGLFLVLKGLSYASTADPNILYEGFLQKLLKSIQGPVALGVGTILIIVSGLAWGLGQHAEGGMKIVFKVGFALSVAFGASALIKGFYEVSTGLLM